MEMTLFDELKSATDEFDAKTGEDADNILLMIKDIWYRQKYLLRIRESLNKFKA
jgi:molecular chaperone HscB